MKKILTSRLTGYIMYTLDMRTIKNRGIGKDYDEFLPCICILPLLAFLYERAKQQDI